MYTLYGPEAKNGDFVLIQDVAYMSASADIKVAQVHNGKAYAASVVPSKGGRYRWLRKETAIIVLPDHIVSDVNKSLIKMNIEADKTTFDIGTEYFSAVQKLLRDASEAETQKRVERYGEEYRYK